MCQKKRSTAFFLFLFVVVAHALVSPAGDIPWTFAPYPGDHEITSVTTLMKSGDLAKIDQGEAQIRTWLEGHQVIWVLWFDWFPALMKIQRYPDVADIAAQSVNSNPQPDVIASLLEWRIRALLLMNKPAEALESAKSYYNACPWKQTDYAVQLVGLCLSQCNPADQTIGQRFRDGQSAASLSGIAAATQPDRGGVGAAGRIVPGAMEGIPMLKSITIDSKLYEDGLTEWVTHTRRANERANYANLLLAADRGEEAETIFRDLYGTARTQDQINIAYEGIARALRAEDGNVARANAWLAGNGGGR